MHDSSYKKMSLFMDKYLDVKSKLNILDLGSQIVDEKHQTYKTLCDVNWHYDGCDIENGLNVDIIMPNPYSIPMPDDSYDVVISGQAFEHIEYIWLTILEIARIVKPGGLICIIAPGTGPIHNCPLDCWRFHPDGMDTLIKWMGFEKLETYIDIETKWWDCVLIAKKPDNWKPLYSIHKF